MIKVEDNKEVINNKGDVVKRALELYYVRCRTRDFVDIVDVTQFVEVYSCVLKAIEEIGE